MQSIHNLRPRKVVRASERAGWTVWSQKGSHVKLTKEGNPNILSVPHLRVSLSVFMASHELRGQQHSHPLPNGSTYIQHTRVPMHHS